MFMMPNLKPDALLPGLDYSISMNAKIAGLFFLGACIILAVLLLKQVVTPTVGSLIFAGALVVFGVLSNGFRKR
jgi:hypothetical protein